MRIGAGTGTAILNTLGEYEPYQTFAFDHDKGEILTLAGGRIENGVLTAGPGELVLPVQILDADFNLELNTAKVQFSVQYDELVGGMTLTGITAGGVHAAEFAEIVKDFNAGDDVIGAVVPILGNLVDLDPHEDGPCQRFSAALKLETTPAYLLD